MGPNERRFQAGFEFQPGEVCRERFLKTDGLASGVELDDLYTSPGKPGAGMEVFFKRRLREDRFTVDDGARIDQAPTRQDFGTRLLALGIDSKAIGERAARVCEEPPDGLGSGLFASSTDVSVALLELVDPACGVDQALLTCVERVGI